MPSQSSGNTPNIYVMKKGDTTVLADGSYLFPGAIQTGSFAKQTFYIINYHPSASSDNNNEVAHDLYSIKLKLECKNSPSGENNASLYLNVFLGDFGDDNVKIDNNKKLNFTDNGATAEGAVKTLAGTDKLIGAGKNIPAFSATSDKYIAITVQAAPQANAKAGTYSYTLSISGKYT